MRKNKIGSLFLVAALALAGIGISYAGFTDTITVFGEVETGTVELKVVDYSGTDVYKVWDWKVTDPDPSGWNWTAETIIDKAEETVIISGFEGELPTESEVIEFFTGNNGYADGAELVAHAMAEAGIGDNEVFMNYTNLFPCKWFKADFVIHYDGSIPAKLYADILPDDTDSDWLLELDNLLQVYKVEPDGAGGWIKGELVDQGHQVHKCNYTLWELSFHVPQSNDYQDRSGSFTARIGALQWNEDPGNHNWSYDWGNDWSDFPNWP
jgi:hypothetical protein